MRKKINIGHVSGTLKKDKKWSKDYFNTKSTKGMGNYEIRIMTNVY